MPDTSTVRSLITSVTELAKHLGYSENAIYRWINVNRIPAGKLLKIASFYNIEIPFHLSTSDKKNKNQLKYKPKDTLPMCLKVQSGEMTEEEAAKVLGLHPRSIQLIIKNWGDDLQTLHEVLSQLDKKEITLDQAALRLNVTKYNIHALRKKYGFRPEPRPKAKERPIVKRRQTSRQVALRAIAGELTLAESEAESGLSWRTIHRMITKLSPDWSLIELTHWPKSFRKAYAEEIEKNLTRIAENLWKFAEISQISVKKWPKYPEMPRDLRKSSLRRLMIHVLLGDLTLDELANSRGADPHILETLFTGDLRPLNLTWPTVTSLTLYQQTALAELLLALEEKAKTPRQRMIERLEEAKND